MCVGALYYVLRFFMWCVLRFDRTDGRCGLSDLSCGVFGGLGFFMRSALVMSFVICAVAIMPFLRFCNKM